MKGFFEVLLNEAEADSEKQVSTQQEKEKRAVP